MQTIHISVKNKIARPVDNARIVCGNSDYFIEFDFDEEWNDYTTKTARFSFGNNSYIDVVFDGNTANVPVLENITLVYVGVFAGDLHTTTPALIGCDKSILCGGGSPADPAPDIYAQIMEKLNALQSSGGGTSDAVTKEDLKVFVTSNQLCYVISTKIAEPNVKVELNEADIEYITKLLAETDNYVPVFPTFCAALTGIGPFYGRYDRADTNGIIYSGAIAATNGEVADYDLKLVLDEEKRYFILETAQSGSGMNVIEIETNNQLQGTLTDGQIAKIRENPANCSIVLKDNSGYSIIFHCGADYTGGGSVYNGILVIYQSVRFDFIEGKTEGVLDTIGNGSLINLIIYSVDNSHQWAVTNNSIDHPRVKLIKESEYTIEEFRKDYQYILDGKLILAYTFEGGTYPAPIYLMNIGISYENNTNYIEAFGFLKVQGLLMRVGIKVDLNATEIATIIEVMYSSKKFTLKVSVGESTATAVRYRGINYNGGTFSGSASFVNGETAVKEDSIEFSKLWFDKPVTCNQKTIVNNKIVEIGVVIPANSMIEGAYDEYDEINALNFTIVDEVPETEELATEKYVDEKVSATVGDINSILNYINGEVV